MIAREVPAFSWFVLLVLGLIYTQQQWSRYSLNYLYNVSQDDDFVSIKHADSISYTEYGILTGYGFSGTFCLAGLVAGRAADISSRKLIIFTGIFAWNVALLMIGYSEHISFYQIFNRCLRSVKHRPLLLGGPTLAAGSRFWPGIFEPC